MIDQFHFSDTTATAAEIKYCCAELYANEWAPILLGDSFHPGGLALTHRIGAQLKLTPQTRVLDVASGIGTSAIYLAEQFGCQIVGIDYSKRSIQAATEAAQKAGVSDLATFEHGDAEELPFPAASFDVIICECAFCTFPRKSVGAAEFARVLRPGGQLGLSDLTRSGALPAELQTLVAWLACIADAQPIDNYVTYLETAGFHVQHVERHDHALNTLIHDVYGKLLGAELMIKLRQRQSDLDFDQARRIAKVAKQAVKAGHLGYGILLARKSPTSH